MISATWQSNLTRKAVAPCWLAVVAAVVVTCAWCVAATGQQTSPRSVNEFCPVMTEEKASPEFTTGFEGLVIGFCCDTCLSKFQANPSRYAARVVHLKEPRSQPIIADQLHQRSAENQPAGTHTHGANAAHIHGDNDAENRADMEAHDHDSGQHEHESTAPAKHDHEHGHAHGESFLARMIGWLGKFHPPTVNFPIAMTLGAALAELLLIATGRSFFVAAARFCLWVGCVGAVAAAVLGWFFGGLHLVDESWVLTTHRWLGTTTAAWSVLLLILGERTFHRTNATRRKYGVVLFIGAALVGVTGFFGGSLVYGLDHYSF